jgi:hypothetical protein
VSQAWFPRILIYGVRLPHRMGHKLSQVVVFMLVSFHTRPNLVKKAELSLYTIKLSYS